MERQGTISTKIRTETEEARSIQEHEAKGISQSFPKNTMPLLNIEPKRPGNPRGTPHTLVRDPQQRKQIHTQKQTKVLQWLKAETYSSPQILGLILGVTSRQAIHKTLTAMQEQGLIRAGQVQVVGGHQTLWGITEHGQAMACDPSKGEIPSGKVFEAGRISALRLKHILTLQKMKWQAIQAGWIGWKNCDRGVKPQKGGEKFKHRPDAVTIDPAGRVVAIELELTFKTVKRYEQEVIPSHARQICFGHQYHHVLWVCPTLEDVKRMTTLIIEATKRLRGSESRAMKQLDAYKQAAGGATIFRLGSADDWTRHWQGQAEDRSKNLRAFLWTRFQDATEEHRDLDTQAQEEREWMAVSDHALIQQTLRDYQQAVSAQRKAEEAKLQEQTRRAEEANRRYAQQLAAQQEAQRRDNSLIGKVGKLFNK